jgi:hypothetical protein
VKPHSRESSLSSPHGKKHLRERINSDLTYPSPDVPCAKPRHEKEEIPLISHKLSGSYRYPSV